MLGLGRDRPPGGECRHGRQTLGEDLQQIRFPEPQLLQQ